MKTVWLLFEHMDYESTDVKEVYAEKPSVETLAALIKEAYFGYDYTQESALERARELIEENKTRFLSLYTWELEERSVK